MRWLVEVRSDVDDAALQRMIQQLRGELEEIRYAVWSLESIAADKPRRGRPPKWIGRFQAQRLGAVVARARPRRAKS